AAGYRLAGQSCASVQNVFVHESVALQFEKAMLDRIKNLKLGDPLDLQTDLGPVINTAAAERIIARIQEAMDGGAKLLAGGKRDNNMVHPTLLSNVKLSSRAVCEEIFGPVLAIQSFRTLDEALEKANNTPYGLSGGVWTDKGAKIFKVTRGIKAGVIWANTFNKFDPSSPFGGYKESGYGREGGRHGLRPYVELS
ncbi:aldehyde dehydrogenase family protein, partial [bacterium]|nr:aldehyde dehydrogenase family protein [bacterium]